MQTPQKNRDVNGHSNQPWPSRTYFLILFVTVVLLISFTVTLVAVLLIGGDDTPRPSEDPNGNGGSNNGIFGNYNSLYPTTATRDSYLSTTAENVIHIGNAINSNNSILVDLSTYTSVAEKGADQVIYPASMTKVMTLLVACENVTSLDKKLVVAQEDIDYKNTHGGSGLLVASSLGDGFTIEDLLYMISYKSDTIACLMIAKEIAGGEDGLVSMMNAKARQLGLTKTNFTNCTGLHNVSHVTTCREMAAIMAYALENELARKILLSTDTRAIPAYDGNSDTKVVTYWAHCEWYTKEGGTRFKGNVVLDTVTVKAAKTGYTDEAGVCLVSYAETKSKKGYINVIVGKPKGSGLTESISTQEVRDIYNNYAK